MFRWTRRPDGSWLGVDGTHWWSVAPGGDGDLRVRSNGDRGDFERLFRLEISLADVEREVLSRGPELAPYVAALPGLRQMRPSCPREVLFSFLCTANNNLARIGPMVRHLASYGEALAEVDGIRLTRFPTFERVAGLGEEELRTAGFGYRARTIPKVASQILGKGGAWWGALARAPYSDLVAELVSLDGIGPKLADCIALFGFHKNEAAPMDTHLWQACCRHYFPEWKGKALTERRYRAAADHLRGRFGSWTGWAHQYLFYDNLLNWRSR